MDAANTRFNFWKKRVKEGVNLTDDEKARIISPTHKYGYAGLFPDSYYEAKIREQTEALTIENKDGLSDEEKSVIKDVEDSFPELEAMQKRDNYKLPILRIIRKRFE